MDDYSVFMVPQGGTTAALHSERSPLYDLHLTVICKQFSVKA